MSITDMAIRGAAKPPLFRGARAFMDVILHIGAHRTATTTLQRYLARHSAVIGPGATALWETERCRGGLFSGLVRRPDLVTDEDDRRARRSTGLIRMEMDRLAQRGTARLIVTEENMIGSVRDNLDRSQLYPDAGARLARFAAGFGPVCTRIALSIRSYEGWWASSLAYAVTRGRGLPGDDALDRLVTQPRGWRDLVADAAAAFPRAEILVWPFEALGGQPEAAAAALGGSAVPLPVERERLNASPGLRGLRLRLAERGDFTGASMLGQGEGRWQPFGPHHLRALARRYADDLDWLRNAAGPRVTYIESTGKLPGGMTAEEGRPHDGQNAGMG